MSFYASNDRIWIADTNGDIAFDTNNNMPHIIGVYEANISKMFIERYYTEHYFTIASLPSDVDFVICRANCTPTNMATGVTGAVGSESVGTSSLSVDVPWQRLAPQGDCFFQGSLLLEAGCTGREDKMAMCQYARRALHVYPEPAWGNKLICMFQQGVKSGWGAVPAGIAIATADASNLRIPYTAYGTIDVNGKKSPGIITAYVYNPANAVVAKYGTLVGVVTDVNTGSVIEDWEIDLTDPAVVSALWANGDITKIAYGPCTIRWDISLKVWAGRFRK